MCVLCKIDKPCQDINYLKFDKCVEITEFSNRYSRVISLPCYTHPFKLGLLCSHSMGPHYLMACEDPKSAEGTQRGVLCCCRCCRGDTSANPWGIWAWKQQRVRRPLESSPSMSFPLVKLGARGGGTFLLQQRDKKLPVSSRMVLQSCLFQQTNSFQLIAESF